MRVFITGATGFIGTAIVPDLIKNGHTVLGLVRSDSSAAKLKSLGGEPLIGTIEDVDILKQGAASSDAIVHLAFVMDFTNFFARSIAIDIQAITSIGEAIKGTAKPFIISSGTLIGLPVDRMATEDDIVISSWNPRAKSEVKVRELANEGINIQIVRLTPSVHGDGDKGIVPKMIATAKEKGAAAYIVDGMNVWPAVHRLDAAVLYRLAIEKGTPGAVWHAVSDEAIPIKEIAGVIGKKLGVPVVSKTVEEAEVWFGGWAAMIKANNPCKSQKTRERLGWKPVQVGLLADLQEGGFYFEEGNIGRLHEVFG